MLAVLAVLCPPLAVLFAAPSSFPKSCALTLLLFVPGVLHARRVVDAYHTHRRYDTLLRLLEAKETRRPVAQAA
jgi:uncharacterized membrane protein YqaE (UPF0057 family)